MQTLVDGERNFCRLCGGPLIGVDVEGFKWIFVECPQKRLNKQPNNHDSFVGKEISTKWIEFDSVTGERVNGNAL